MKHSITHELLALIVFALLPTYTFAQQWDYDGGNTDCGSKTLNRGEQIIIESADIARIERNYTDVDVWWTDSYGFVYSQESDYEARITGYAACSNSKLVATIYYTQNSGGRKTKWKRSYTWYITVNDPYIEPVKKTVELAAPGTLSGRISSSDKNRITHLTIIGEINGTDIKFIREMAGSGYNLNYVNGRLRYLNLKDAKIRAGGDAYVMAYGEEQTCFMDDVVPAYAFRGCSKLEEIILPDNVFRINSDAFMRLALLEKVDLPEELRDISYYNFAYCISLKSLTIPKKVKSISTSFESSKNLTTIYCYATNPPTMNSSFSINTNITNGTLYVPEGSRRAYLSATGWMGFGNIYETLPPNPQIKVDSEYFPDNNFREYISTFDQDKDGVLSDDEIAKVTNISISSKSINSLEGIDYFTALKYLYCDNNQLTSLDVSKNTALTSLYCYNNQLTALDITKNTALTSLNCGSNKLSVLNVSNNVALTSLSCYENQLTALDVTKNTALTSLTCGSNKLSVLDVSKNTALTSLYCYENQLTALDVTKNTALTSLNCDNNKLSVLDVSKNTALTSLYCYENQLTTLDVTKNTALTSLNCGRNKLSVLNVSNNVALSSLSCYENQLTALDVAKNTALAYLSCEDNQLTALDVSKNTALKTLYCGRNQLISLDVSKNTALTSLYCGSNKLSVLDVSKNTALTSLYCYENQLTALDVTKNTALTSLNCGRNKLSVLNVSENVALTSLYCYENQLTAVDVSNNKAIKAFSCFGNQLTNLDVSKNVELDKLWCYKNQLTSLDVSKNTALTLLRCSSNKINNQAMNNLIQSLSTNNTDNAYRFLVYDSSDENEGNTVTKAQVSAVKAKGWTPECYNGTDWVECDGHDPISVQGDVNEDEKVNGTDLVALTNIILGKSAEKAAADVNGDGKVNGTDYVALANIILGKSSARRRMAAAGDISTASGTASLQMQPLSIRAGETKVMEITLTNPDDELTLLQFDLILPDGLTIVDGNEANIGSRAAWKHQLATYVNEAKIRCLLASSENELIEGTTGTIVRLTVTAGNDFAGGTITLKDILGVTPSEKEVPIAARSYSLLEGGTTGIYNIGNAQSEAAVYSLSGQRVASPAKGINIIDGRKVLKK